MFIDGNSNNFDELLNAKIVLVDFYADWCGPCRMLTPLLEVVASSRNIKVVRVNVDKEEALARRFNIMSIPTILLYKDGLLVGMKNGYLPQPILESWLDENMNF